MHSRIALRSALSPSSSHSKSASSGAKNAPTLARTVRRGVHAPSQPRGGTASAQQADAGRRQLPQAHACAALRGASQRCSGPKHAPGLLLPVTAAVWHQRTSATRGRSAAPGRRKTAFRRCRHASPPARSLRGKLDCRATTYEQRRARVLDWRRVRAPVCRTARAAACAGLSAQTRPVSSMTSPGAANDVCCATKPVRLAFGSAARGAGMHANRRRCGGNKSLVLARWHCAHRQDASPDRFGDSLDWKQRGAQQASASTHRREAALTPCSPRSPAVPSAWRTRAARPAAVVRQRKAGAAPVVTLAPACKHELKTERSSPRAQEARWRASARLGRHNCSASSCGARKAAERVVYARLQVPGVEPFRRMLRSAAPAACCTQRLEAPASSSCRQHIQPRGKRAAAAHSGARGFGRHAGAVTPAPPRAAHRDACGSSHRPSGICNGVCAAAALENALGGARRACTGRCPTGRARPATARRTASAARNLAHARSWARLRRSRAHDRVGAL